MRHAVFVTLLALATSSLSLTAEARWHHWHHRHYRHHHRHYRHHGHHHRRYYLQARHIDHHHRHHRTHAMRPLPPALGTRAPLARQSRNGWGPGDASAGRQPIPQQHAAPLPKSPAVAAAPAAAAARGTAKAVASAAPARRVPDWKYPPATIKRVPGGKQHVLAPDTGSFVIIPGYKIVK